MHILHIYKDYYPVLGGIENHMRWLATAQAERGHRVTVLVTNPDGHGTTIRQEEGVQVIRASRWATVASTPLSLALPRHLRGQNPDIVHLHFPYPPGEISQWLLRRGRATVLSYHSDVVRQSGILKLYDPLLRHILRRVDRIIADSEPYVRSSPYLRPLAQRCTVIPLGVDVARFATSQGERAAAIQARHPGPLLLFVGRLRYYKGLEYLIEAMRQVSATLLIVGAGPEAVRLGEQSYLSGVADRVRFLGDVSDEQLPAYYQAADIFVLPSSARSEAFGIVLLEALAAGLPVISTELGTGTSWVNQHGVTGLVAPPRDAQALAHAINELLDSPQQRQAMAAAARRRAQTFDLSALVGRVMELYEEVLAGLPAYAR